MLGTINLKTAKVRVYLIFIFVYSLRDLIQIKRHDLCFGKAVEYLISKMLHSLDKKDLRKVDALIYFLGGGATYDI